MRTLMVEFHSMAAGAWWYSSAKLEHFGGLLLEGGCHMYPQLQARSHL